MADTASISSAPAPAAGSRSRRLAPVLIVVGGGLLAVILGIQLIPVTHTNPPVTSQLPWDSPQTEALARRACFDCHSNETTWPVYASIAPTSWLVYYDVQRGRSELNFSTYDPAQPFNRGNRFDQPQDTAYRLGQLLSFLTGTGGPGEGGGPDRPRGQGGEGRQFPTLAPGQAPPQFGPGGFGEGGFGGGRLADQLTNNLQNNRMPPANYLLLHPDANLTADERQQLLKGLLATLKLSTP